MSEAKNDDKPKRGRGRPKARIDPDELEKLGALQCTTREVAAWFEINHETLHSRWNKEPALKERFLKGKERGKTSLRRKQMRLAETNASMAIFLGKNILGQRDQTQVEHSGEIGISGILKEIDGGTTKPGDFDW